MSKTNKLREEFDKKYPLEIRASLAGLGGSKNLIVDKEDLWHWIEKALSQKEEGVRREVETFKNEAIDFILGGYPSADLMKHKIDIVKKTDLKT